MRWSLAVDRAFDGQEPRYRRTTSISPSRDILGNAAIAELLWVATGICRLSIGVGRVLMQNEFSGAFFRHGQPTARV